MGHSRSIPVLLSLSVLALGSCAFAKSFEKDLTIHVYEQESEVMTGTVNIFNNLLLPTHTTEIPGHKFYRWCIGDFVLGETEEDRLYTDGALVRYNHVSSFAKDGQLTFNAVYLTPDELPKPYLVIGWYDKTSTSKLNQSIIDKWTPHLKDFVAENGATPEEIDDIDIRAYSHNGNVAALGAEVNRDMDVDLLLGVGNNVDSAKGANIPIVEKTGDIPMGGGTRYVALLTERPMARLVYEWVITEAGYQYLA